MEYIGQIPSLSPSAPASLSPRHSFLLTLPHSLSPRSHSLSSSLLTLSRPPPPLSVRQRHVALLTRYSPKADRLYGYFDSVLLRVLPPRTNKIKPFHHIIPVPRVLNFQMYIYMKTKQISMTFIDFHILSISCMVLTDSWIS